MTSVTLQELPSLNIHHCHNALCVSVRAPLLEYIDTNHADVSWLVITELFTPALLKTASQYGATHTHTYAHVQPHWR